MQKYVKKKFKVLFPRLTGLNSVRRMTERISQKRFLRFVRHICTGSLPRGLTRTEGGCFKVIEDVLQSKPLVLV